MASTWRNLLPRDPLTALTVLALVPRVLAAFFSGGYFAHDDHFLVMRRLAAGRTVPTTTTGCPGTRRAKPRPSRHNFFYVGFHYLLLVLLKGIGITPPEGHDGVRAPGARGLEPDRGAHGLPDRTEALRG